MTRAVLSFITAQSTAFTSALGLANSTSDQETVLADILRHHSVGTVVPTMASERSEWQSLKSLQVRPFEKISQAFKR
jgi:hypothetical protein